MMTKSLETLLIACSLLAPSWSSPKALWPLTSQTILRDMENLDTSSSFVNGASCPLLTSDAKYGSYGSFYYDGTGSSVADLKIKDSGPFDDCSFTMWLKPDVSALSSTQVLFEYQSNREPSGNYVTRVRAELVNGLVNFTVGKSSVIHGTLLSNAVLSSSAFTNVFLSTEKDNSRTKMYLIIGNDKKKDNLAQEYPIEVPGTWRVGGSWTPGDSLYTGNINCVAFFDYYVEPPRNDGEYVCVASYAGDVSGYNIPKCSISDPPTPASQTTTAGPQETTSAPPVTPSNPQPVHLWPLDEVTRGYDVIAGSPPLTSQETLACFRTGIPSSPTLYLYNPFLYFDGSLHSQVEMQVSESVFGDGDFSVVLFVEPQQPPEGRLWSYASSQGGTGVWRAEVSLDSSGSLTTTVWDSGPACYSPCGVLTAPGVFDDDDSGTDSLTMVAVHMTATELRMEVNESAWNVTDTCSRSAAGGSADGGVLSVAGRAEGLSAGFRGFLPCVAIFSPRLQTFSRAGLLSQCVDHAVDASSQSTTVCANTTETRNGAFSLLARHSQPKDPPLAPTESVPTSSVIECASYCTRTDHCRSFVASRQNAVCRLYDFVTLTALVSSPENGNYYQMKTTAG